jgi:hypothetical protein
VPLLNTSSPATGNGRMLSTEKKMPSHRCLFAIIFKKAWGSLGIYKLKYLFFGGFKIFSGIIIRTFGIDLNLDLNLD